MKKILNLTITTCIALAIVGCGGTNNTKESASTEQTSTTVESTAAESTSKSVSDAKHTMPTARRYHRYLIRLLSE